ncbi:hypothetical protein ACN28S_51020 [Cystobacter fuscus]
MVQTSARLLKVLSLLQSQRFWAGGDRRASSGSPSAVSAGTWIG